MPGDAGVADERVCLLLLQAHTRLSGVSGARHSPRALCREIAESRLLLLFEIEAVPRQPMMKPLACGSNRCKFGAGAPS